ncbi:MAG: hypothetical protein H6704_17160 [Myxococcales bacterium]|nr:hypothetical protein [Myxococcales bacterium]
MRAVYRAGLVVAVVAGCSKPAPPAAADAAPPAKALAVDAAATPAPTKAAAAWPASDRVFAVTVGGRDLILGADADALWAAPAAEAPPAKPLWRVTGPGVVTHVVAGDLGQGPRLFVGRGLGRGFLDAPLVVQALDPATGAATELWRHEGPRNELAHLSIADVDRDGAPELALAYYASKYMVRTRHLEADGAAHEGPEVRMASSRVFGDLDGDGVVDQAVGRVYGDAKGEPGDLTVHLASGPVKVPVEQGVRSLLVAQLGDDTGPTLYVADGWVANYGKEARAQVKRVRFTGGQPTVQPVAGSPEEFTFFELWAVDPDGDGKAALAARGNKALSLFPPGATTPWPRKALRAVPPVLNAAIAKTGAGHVAVVPGRLATQVTPLR